ncbi:MAG: NnrS family protein [Alcaligenaceae bacterium]|nr:NnrS family protein [Alcaligenaceae bacterium]
MNEPTRDAAATRPAPDLSVFLSLGFRPLYICGCAWALISVAIWIFTPALIPAPFFAVAWHAHEMLWGFIATIAVGFLLTASATWTGFNPMQGRPLAVITLMWLGARIAYLAGGETAFIIGMALESLFFGYSARKLMQVMIKGKSKRNYGIPLLVLGLGVSNILFLLSTLKGDYLMVIERFNTGMLFMAVLTILIARRVVPFFAGRMVPGLDIPMLAGSGRVQLVVGSVAIAAGLFNLNVAMAVALAIVGLIGLYQVWRWKPLSVLHKPMLWILYLGYLGLALGLLAAALHLLGMGGFFLLRDAAHVHIIGMGGFALLIIGMVTRTALGHTGRPLALDKTMLASYWLMVAAVVLRLAALFPTSFAGPLLHATATAWVIAMALYLYRYVPILITPRADAPPKTARPSDAPIPTVARR